MKETIKIRLAALRATMKKQNLDAYLIFGTDPHLSEYLPEYWQTRKYISGFTGSAGMVIVTPEKAALWTDSRYFLQAELELDGTEIDLVKMRTAGHPEPVEWLKLNLNSGDIAGTDEWCISINQFLGMKKQLHEAGILLENSGDLLDQIWSDRPALPNSPVYEHELKFACTPRKEKMELIISELEKAGADIQVISALDDLAWTFNLRGSDVECNPVFLAYACISKQENVLFIDSGKLSSEVKQKLENEGILIYDYLKLTAYLKKLPEGFRLLIDADRTSQAIEANIPEYCQVIHQLSIPCRLKALKTDAEISHIRQAMRKDGAAMVEFLYWLKNNVGQALITEYSVAEKLMEFRSKQSGYKGISFFPIIGYKEHGAIVHFHVTPENALTVEKDGFLLFDSGGQYLDGTTDITRTVALSELTAKQRKDFTLVLKGMIGLTQAKFPTNTGGYHLDILARQYLWQNGLNYGHGTGHGVGYFLNVHEGPMSIRQEFNDRPIEAGMVLSNEPALYRPGEYGLRTENLIVCRKSESNEFGDFLEFDTLTLCPIDTTAIDKAILTDKEADWLNNYHARVYYELSPLLSEELRLFLEEFTKAI